MPPAPSGAALSRRSQFFYDLIQGQVFTRARPSPYVLLGNSSTVRCLMRRIVRLMFSAALLAGATLTATAVGASADPSPPASLCADAVTATFGPNVCVFTPQMSQAAIQSDLNAIATQQVPL